MLVNPGSIFSDEYGFSQSTICSHDGKQSSQPTPRQYTVCKGKVETYS